MNNLNRMDEWSRRGFAAFLAKTFLGVGLLPVGGAAAAFGSPAVGTRGGSAKRVIYLFMNGGMSHLDTFDPKPGSEVQGPVQTIGTRADGVIITEYLPRTAGQMDKVAVLRSIHSTQGAHERGRYFMRTSYTQRGTIRHPALGAWALRLGGKLNPSLPGNVRIGTDSQHPGAGFMEEKFSPVPIGNPASGLQNSRMSRGLTEGRFEKRLRLADSIDADFRRKFDQKPVRAYTDAYREALGLMKSSDLNAFDLRRESESTRAAYGESRFGQGCLLARRLIEHDVRFVEVSHGGWDTHQANFERLPDLTAELDQGFSALLNDLAERGLLTETLVVLATEFGRTPAINQNEGRDHYPKAFSCLLAGGGVQGGQVYGKTDEKGAEVVENPVSIPDFNATIAHAMGLPRDEVILSPSGRPFTVAHKGKPVTALFGAG